MNKFPPRWFRVSMANYECWHEHTRNLPPDSAIEYLSVAERDAELAEKDARIIGVQRERDMNSDSLRAAEKRIAELEEALKHTEANNRLDAEWPVVKQLTAAQEEIKKLREMLLAVTDELDCYTSEEIASDIHGGDLGWIKAHHMQETIRVRNAARAALNGGKT